jgi:hypothetical protein
MNLEEFDKKYDVRRTGVLEYVLVRKLVMLTLDELIAIGDEPAKRSKQLIEQQARTFGDDWNEWGDPRAMITLIMLAADIAITLRPYPDAAQRLVRGL